VPTTVTLLGVTAVDPHAAARPSTDGPAATPLAKHVPHTWHRPTGDVDDPWAWLRDRDDPDTIAYLDAENAYAESWFGEQTALVDTLFAEIKSRVQETDAAVPVRKDGWWYTSRTEEGLNYAIHCRGRSRETATETVLLDENAEAAEHDYFSLGLFEVSPDHGFAAWSRDVDGSELYELRVRDLAAGTDLDDLLTGTSAWGGAAWSADGGHLFYMMPDAQMRPFQVWRHRIGTAQAEDVLVLEETDERFFLGVDLSRSGEWILLEASSKQSSEAWIVPAASPTEAPTSVRPRVDGIEYGIDHWGDSFVVLTNLDAEDFRVMMAPIDDPGSWTELLPHVPGQRITTVEPFATHLVIHEWSDAQQRVREVERVDLHVQETGDGLGGGVRVEGGEDQVSRHRRLHTDLRRLRIAHLADHDDVGILAEDRAERGGEGDARLTVHWHLRNAAELIFDRILDRNDLLARAIALGEAGVERRRLAAAGRSRGEEHPVRLCGEALDVGEQLRRHAELRERDGSAAAIEKTKHDALTEHRGDGGDAEIELARLEANADAAVLRAAALGDVELREELDARDDGMVELRRWLEGSDEDAVDADAGGEACSCCFQVDVGGASVVGVADEEVDVADYRGLGGEVADVCR